MKFAGLTIAVCGLLCAFAGCRKFNDSDENGDLILVSVGSEATKATLMTEEYLKNNYKKFRLDAFVEKDSGLDAQYKYPKGTRLVNSASMENVTKKDSGVWSIAGAPTWITSTPLSFWAAIGVNINYAIGTSGLFASANESAGCGPHWDFDYTLPSSVTEQTDVLMAYNIKEYTGGGEEGRTVRLHFFHALASIRVCISPDDGSFDVFRKGSDTDHNLIRKIMVRNVATKGRGQFMGDSALAYINSPSENIFKHVFQWPDGKLEKKTESVTLLTGESGTEVAGADGSMTGWTKGTYQRDGEPEYTLFTCDEQIMMIPQLLSEDAVMEIYMNDSAKPLSASIARNKDGSPITLEAGKYYKFKLNYSYQGDEIHFTAVLDSWNNKSVDIEL